MGVGRILAQRILSEVSGEPSEEDLSKREARLARAVQTEIFRRNQKLAEQVGLSISFPSGDEEQEWALDMRVNLTKGTRFLEYLRAFSGCSLSESQQKGLQKIAGMINKQITNDSDLQSPDDHFMELVKTLGDISSAYARLVGRNPKMEASAVALSEIYDAIRAGYLREYVAAKNAQLLDPAGAPTFGPSRWHTDASETTYRNNWDGALEVVRKIQKNRKATDLAKRCITNLIKSVEYAKQDMNEKLQSTEYKAVLWNNRTFQYLEKILADLRAMEVK